MVSISDADVRPQLFFGNVPVLFDGDDDDDDDDNDLAVLL